MKIEIGNSKLENLIRFGTLNFETLNKNKIQITNYTSNI